MWTRLEAVPEMVRILINNAMQIERSSICKQENRSAPKNALDMPMDISQDSAHKDGDITFQYHKGEKVASIPRRLKKGSQWTSIDVCSGWNVHPRCIYPKK